MGDGLLVPKFVRDDGSLPIHAFAHVGSLLSSETAIVGFCTNEEDVIGPVDLIEHPARPPLQWRALHILINHRVEAIGAQAFRQFENTLSMFLVIVTIGHEYLRVTGLGVIKHLVSPCQNL